MPALVTLDGVAKSYPKVHRKRDRLAGLAASLLGRRHLSSYSILEDISLTVQGGESLAIIGENGAGKSTLLKLVAGVLHPTKGQLRVRGSIGALLELGAGFHPDHTGRRNLLMAASLLGFSSKAAQALVPQVAEFAELQSKLDEPIKHYSSGMVVRLGFALIAHTRPDLLISDEVLAVGDHAFQRKCVAWLEQYLADGGTLLLVSHSLYHVQKLCHKACWIQAGRIHQYGDVFEVGQAYLAYHEAKLDRGNNAVAAGRVVLDQLRVNHIEQSERLAVSGDASLELCLCASEACIVEIELARADGAVLAAGSCAVDSGTNQLGFELPALLPAQYVLAITPNNPAGQRLGNPLRRLFQVAGQSREFGSLRLSHQWPGHDESAA